MAAIQRYKTEMVRRSETAPQCGKADPDKQTSQRWVRACVRRRRPLSPHEERAMYFPMTPSVGIIIYESRLKIHRSLWCWSGWGCKIAEVKGLAAVESHPSAKCAEGWNPQFS